MNPKMVEEIKKIQISLRLPYLTRNRGHLNGSIADFAAVVGRYYEML